MFEDKQSTKVNCNSRINIVCSKFIYYCSASRRILRVVDEEENSKYLELWRDSEVNLNQHISNTINKLSTAMNAVTTTTNIDVTKM